MEYLPVPKYCDAHSVLLVNQRGILRRLYCPFRVRCKEATGAFIPGMWLWVEEVAITSRDELCYWIMGNCYAYSSFETIISF